MKKHILYPEFIIYLDSQLSECKISKGKFSLLKISSSYFNWFVNKYESDELFQKMVIKNYRTETRDKKINDIFNDFDI